jgi:hypothetical protein
LSGKKSKIDLEEKIMTMGKKIKAKIISCKCTDDPDDPEHEIFEIEFQYRINDNNIKKEIMFSINTAHIEYAYLGELIGVPKLKYSLNDFKKSLMPGEVMEIISLDKPPFQHINHFNKISRKVMSIPEVWS